MHILFNRRAARLRKFIIELPRAVKGSVAFAFDLIGFAACVFAALWLMQLDSYVSQHAFIVLATAIVAALLGWLQGMYRSVVRFMGVDLFIVATRTALGSALFGAVMLNVIVFGATPFRWAAAYVSFTFIFVVLSRFLAREFLLNKRSQADRQKVIVYGAGEAAGQLVTSLQSGDQFRVVALLDDDEHLHGQKVKGLEIFPPSYVESLCRKLDVDRVLLAMPSARHGKRRSILDSLESLDVHVQTIPTLADIVSGEALVDELKEVELEDLLGRDAVSPIPELLDKSVAGKNVLITGAGGSIGSELSRQILKLQPKTLVLFERSEPALYEIEQELRALAIELEAPCEIVALLGSVCNRSRGDEVMRSFRINTVYHAAAYKHVPVVERNLLEGVQNNVFGTLHMAQAAVDANVENFVLISTDKAVSPANVMGATKRFAELILQGLQTQCSGTCFCMVRFGNVLGSSGSVVPLFRKQIRSGGPVTVTHRDIIRYFMTIPEAAQLVIQAGAMGKGGDVFVLDMGEPMKIVDLAARMIRLMGLQVIDDEHPEGDIEIRITGLRPAEKLYEELLIGSNVCGTEHQRIMKAEEDYLPFAELVDYLTALREACDSRDRSRARSLLMQVVSEYCPANDIDDLIQQSRVGSEVVGSETVVEFPGGGASKDG